MTKDQVQFVDASVLNFPLSEFFLRGSSPASALPQPVSRTRPWPTTSSPSGILPIPGCPLWGNQPGAGMWWTKALRARRRYSDGETAMEPGWSVRPSTTAEPAPSHDWGNPWPKELRRWLAGIRQMVEIVFDKLHHAFRLDWERPHQLEGFQTRLAAKAALHNFCIWLNRQLGRPVLAFADLLAC